MYGHIKTIKMKTMQPYLSPKLGIRKSGRINEETCYIKFHMQRNIH